MPHDAALFATSVRQRKSPAQTEALIAAEVAAAQVKYDSSEDQATRDFGVLAGLSPVKPVINTLSPATIASGGGTHSCILAGTGFKAGMKVLWDTQLLTPTVLNPTNATVVPTKKATAGTWNVVAINYDQTLEARSAPKPFIYT